MYGANDATVNITSNVKPGIGHSRSRRDRHSSACGVISVPAPYTSFSDSPYDPESRTPSHDLDTTVRLCNVTVGYAPKACPLLSQTDQRLQHILIHDPARSTHLPSNMASRSFSHDFNNTAKPLPIIPRRSSALSNIPSGAPELMGNSSVTVTIERPTPPHSNRRTPPASAVGSDSSSDSENRRLPHPRKGGDSRALSSRAEEKTGVSYAVGRKQQRGDARRRRPVVALFELVEDR